MKKILIGIILMVLLSFELGFCFLVKEGFKEFGFLGGYNRANLKEKKDLEEIPFILRFGFDLRPLIKNKSNYLFEFTLEPYTSLIMEPKSNFMGGCNFLLKFGFPLKKVYPYLEGGFGFNYFTLHTREQSTQFNFSEIIGVGINYFLKENLSLNLGYRARHISNASIKKPNQGIDTQGFIFGVSIYY